MTPEQKQELNTAIQTIEYYLKDLETELVLVKQGLQVVKGILSPKEEETF